MNYSDVIEKLSAYSPKFYIFSGATTSTAASFMSTLEDLNMINLFATGFVGALGAGLAKILVTNFNSYIEKRKKEKELLRQYLQTLEAQKDPKTKKSE